MGIMKKLADALVDRLFCGSIGLAAIYALEWVCKWGGFPIMAGVNWMTFLFIAILGIPGFFLVFAVGLIGSF